MRRRSGTIHATNFDEYQKVAVNSLQHHLNSSSSNLEKISKSPKKENFDPQTDKFKGRNSRISSFGKKPLQKVVDSDNWDEFDYNPGDPSGILGKIEGSLQNGLSIQQEEVEYIEKDEEQINKTFMIIGTKEAEKHKLLKEIIDSPEADISLREDQIMDLVLKSEFQYKTKLSYRFWIHSINQDKRYKELVRLYYKRTDLFIFVYSLSNEKSFLELEEAIQNVLKEVPKEEFKGILIGHRNSGDEQGEIPLSQAVSLKEKYGLLCCIESDSSNWCLKKKISDLLNIDEAT